MVIIAQLTSGTVSMLLAYFLLRSRTELPSLPRLQKWVCLAGCWLLLCLGGPWAVQFPAAAMAAVAMAHFVGQMKLAENALFSLFFLVLYAISRICLQAVTEPVNRCLLQSAILYTLVLCFAAFGKRWRMVAGKLVALLPPLLVQALLCGICIFQAQRTGVAMLQFLCCLFWLCSAFGLLKASRQAEDALSRQMQMQQSARHYLLQEEYYSQLLEKQKQTRALWHDLNKYLRAAKAETAPSDALTQLEAMLNDATAIVDVGNPVLNVILNEYTQSAKAYGIELRLKVQVPDTLFVSTADLYVLIGNTMDNAIEACRCLPQHQRFIETTVRIHHDMLYYQVVNPYDHRTIMLSRGPMHGHGLENARRCAEKYAGALLTQQDKGFFIVSAHLNKPPENSS